jgi:hypothetical protein
MKLVRLIKMCLNETHSKLHTGKNLSDACPIQNSLKQEDALSPSLFNFASVCNQEGPTNSGRTGVELNTSPPHLCQ